MGNPGDDILIAGATAYDADRLGLSVLWRAWNRTGLGNGYGDRVTTLTTGVPLDASPGSPVYRLRTDTPGRTVFDDSAGDVFDTLTGASGDDWFFANLTVGEGGVIDKITGGTAGEIKNHVD